MTNHNVAVCVCLGPGELDVVPQESVFQRSGGEAVSGSESLGESVFVI